MAAGERTAVFRTDKPVLSFVHIIIEFPLFFLYSFEVFESFSNHFASYS
jgi:hypothetical protein